MCSTDTVPGDVATVNSHVGHVRRGSRRDVGGEDAHNAHDIAHSMREEEELHDVVAVVAQAALDARLGADWRRLPLHEHVLTKDAVASSVTARSSRSPSLGAFQSLLLPVSPARQLAVAIAHAVAIASQSGTANRPAQPTRPARLNVAIVRGSANANTGRLVSLLSLSRSDFSSSLFTTQLDAAALAELHAAAPGGRIAHTALGSVSTGEAADRLSQHCAILVDCSGHTAGNLLHALARRPCPVATSALGYAGSYGGGLVDYLGSDRIVTPPTARHAHARSERLSIAPHTYQVGQAPSGSPLASPAPSALSLVARSPLLGSFTRAVRWHPSSFALWAGVRASRARTRRADGGRQA